MVSIILYSPQIPPNTGNIMRLCANTGFSLCLIQPLGFKLDDTSLKRAKLDYSLSKGIKVFDNLKKCISTLGAENFIVLSKFAKKNYNKATFHKKSVLLFGSEVDGLPSYIFKDFSNVIYKIPMIENSRSLNLSNSVSIVAYEAWKSLEFCGALK